MKQTAVLGETQVTHSASTEGVIPPKGRFSGLLDREARRAIDEAKLVDAIEAADPELGSLIAGRLLRLQDVDPFSIPDSTVAGRVTDHKRELLETLRQSEVPTDPVQADHRQSVMRDLTRKIVDQVGRVRVDDDGLTVFAPEGPYRLDTPFPLTVAESRFTPARYSVDSWFSQTQLDFQQPSEGDRPTRPLTLPVTSDPDTTGRMYPVTRIDPNVISLEPAATRPSHLPDNR